MEYFVTRDMEELKAMLTVKSVYARMTNDSTPRREDFRIENPDRFIAVVAKGQKGNEAVFLLFPSDAKTAEVHFSFLPVAWGRTQAIAQDFLGWVFANTSLQRLIGPVPKFNSLALKLAKSAGFTQFEVEPNAVVKHGRVYDRILLEYRRPSHA